MSFKCGFKNDKCERHVGTLISVYCDHHARQIINSNKSTRCQYRTDCNENVGTLISSFCDKHSQKIIDDNKRSKCDHGGGSCNEYVGELMPPFFCDKHAQEIMGLGKPTKEHQKAERSVRSMFGSVDHVSIGEIYNGVKIHPHK